MSSITHRGHHPIDRTLTEIGSSTLAASLLATALAFPCVLAAWLGFAFGLHELSHSTLLSITEATIAILMMGLSAGVVLLAGGRVLRHQ